MLAILSRPQCVNSNMAADVLAPCIQVINNHGINLVG